MGRAESFVGPRVCARLIRAGRTHWAAVQAQAAAAMEIPEADSSSSMGSPGWLAVLDNLPTEQMNFLLGQICALPLALIFRKYLHPTKTNPIVRHAVATLLGFYLCMFCYGWCTVFILGEVIVSYVILLVSDRSRVHVYSLLFAMGYLTIFQINRLLDSSEEFSDFTVPMMILTQKITKVAFELHDGTARPPESLSPSQKIQALRKLPSPLEYLSYNFNFMGILAGPLCSYNDYVSFIEGTHYQRGGDLDQLKENGTQKRSEPSPTNAVLEKVVTSFLLLAIHMTLSKVVPVAYNIEESFFGTAPLLHRLLYLYISFAACRPKYYIAWTLADAIHNAAGFGFSGYGKDGKPRWDLIRNLCIVRIELATSLKMFIDNWNIQTAVWLKEICYDRCAASPTLATFVLSAVWHGVHPGYYLTFLTGMLMTLAARAVRRNLRHRFLISTSHKIFYDVVTWAATQVAVSYIVAPFILLYLGPSLKFYRSYWFCLHLLAAFLILLLPKKRQSPCREAEGAGHTLQDPELRQNGCALSMDSNGNQARKAL